MTEEAIPSPRARVIRSVERILLITGVILLSAYLGVRLYGVIVSRSVVAAFQQKTAVGFLSSHADSSTTARPAGLDTSLWSDKRIRAYNYSLSRAFRTPLAVLSMGESWHNSHHADPTCARHGVLRGQVDISARLIWAFERLGWATDVRWPKADRLAAKRA